MKRICSISCLLAICLLTGCANADAQGQEPVCTTETAAALTQETQPETTVSATAATIAETTDTTIVTETLASEAETEPPTVSPESLTPETVPESTQAPTPETEPVTEPVTEPEPVYETFTGILIDTDCSDFDDPPAHDLPCMLMDTCRASGYGLDIQREDGTWYFIPFDENGQTLSWDYLLQTTRMDNLYVTVTGTLTNGVIAVQTLEELP